jgi:hypothetical protein
MAGALLASFGAVTMIPLVYAAIRQRAAIRHLAGVRLSAAPWTGRRTLNDVGFVEYLPMSRFVGGELWKLREYIGAPDTVNMSHSCVADVDLDQLRWMPTIRQLILVDCDISNDGLAVLGRLPRIETLMLCGTPIGDAGVSQLSRLSALRILSLHGTPITDECLDSLARLSRLEQLDLRGTAVTDRCIAALSQLRALRVVRLRGSRVSAGGVTALRRTLPTNCSVEL